MLARRLIKHGTHRQRCQRMRRFYTTELLNKEEEFLVYSQQAKKLLIFPLYFLNFN